MSVEAPLTIRWDGADGISGRASPCGLAVVGVRGQPDRETARLRIRAALATALAADCGVDRSRIALHSPEGAAPWAVAALDAAPRRIPLAISHDRGISVAAYAFHGAVGIDIASILPVPDWEPVARDYLGRATLHALAACPDGERDAAFAHAWTKHEARLKCLGWQLDEWCDEHATALDTCRCFPLSLPDGHVGYLALRTG